MFEIQRIINSMRSVSADLSDIGVRMQDVAVSASMLAHSVEFGNMGTIIKMWADRMEEETSGNKVLCSG